MSVHVKSYARRTQKGTIGIVQEYLRQGGGSLVKTKRILERQMSQHRLAGSAAVEAARLKKGTRLTHLQEQGAQWKQRREIEKLRPVVAILDTQIKAKSAIGNVGLFGRKENVNYGKKLKGSYQSSQKDFTRGTGIHGPFTPLTQYVPKTAVKSKSEIKAAKDSIMDRAIRQKRNHQSYKSTNTVLRSVKWNVESAKKGGPFSKFDSRYKKQDVKILNAKRVKGRSKLKIGIVKRGGKTFSKNYFK